MRVRQTPNAEGWDAMKVESPANSFQMVPIYFHNTILNVIAHLSATVGLISLELKKWRRIASGEHRSSAGVTTKHYKYRQACPHHKHSLLSFSLFLIPLPQSAMIYNYSWKDRFLKRSTHRAKSLEWTTCWKMVRERGPHQCQQSCQRFVAVRILSPPPPRGV